MPTSDEMLQAATDGWQAWVRALVQQIPGGEAFEIDGAPLAATGIDGLSPNGTAVSQRTTDPQKVVDETLEYFERRGIGGGILVREGVDPELERLCATAKMTVVGVLPQMLLAPLPASIPAPIDGLTVRSVTNDDEHAEHVRTDSLGFESTIEMGERAFPRSLRRVSGYHAYTGFIDGAPVASGVLWHTGIAAGVYGIATLPEYRRRGIGEAMTWHVIREGMARGCTFAYLQASTLGRPVYERMGFRLVASYRIWAAAD